MNYPDSESRQSQAPVMAHAAIREEIQHHVLSEPLLVYHDLNQGHTEVSLVHLRPFHAGAYEEHILPRRIN